MPKIIKTWRCICFRVLVVQVNWWMITFLLLFNTFISVVGKFYNPCLLRLLVCRDSNLSSGREGLCSRLVVPTHCHYLQWAACIFSFILEFVICRIKLTNEIFLHEIVKVASNCVILTCAGITDGQLLVFSDPSNVFKSIQFVAMASNPNVDKLIEIFNELIADKFSTWILPTVLICPWCYLIVQDIGCMKEPMCKECTQIAFFNTSNSLKLENPFTLENGATVSGLLIILFCSDMTL